MKSKEKSNEETKESAVTLPKGDSPVSDSTKFLRFNSCPKDVLEFLDREAISSTLLESVVDKQFIIKDIDQTKFKKAFTFLRRHYYKDG